MPIQSGDVKLLKSAVMADVPEGGGAPTGLVIADGVSNANRNWVLIGDDRLFFLFLTNAPGYNWFGCNSYCFGDITSFKPADNYATVLCADDIYGSNSHYISYPGQFNGYGLTQSLEFTGKVLLRSHTQLGNPVRFGLTSLNTNNSSQVCGRGPMPFPNGPDYSLWLLPTYVREESGHMRGLMPGMLWMPQYLPYSDQNGVADHHQGRHHRHPGRAAGGGRHQVEADGRRPMTAKPKICLLDDWRRVLRRAWSIRFSLLAAAFTAAEVVVPLFGDVLPRGAFVLMAFAASIGATVARIVAQPEMHR